MPMLTDPNDYPLTVPRRFLDSPDSLLLVQHAIESDPETRDAAVDIIARAGTIWLLGEVHSSSTRQAVERAARSVSGVADVVNQIQVRE